MDKNTQTIIIYGTIAIIVVYILMKLIGGNNLTVVERAGLSEAEAMAHAQEEAMVQNTFMESYPNTYSGNNEIPYHVRGNRYMDTGKNTGGGCGSPFNSKCDSTWDVNHPSGANGVCSDNLWHKASPRTIMQDNSMQCGQFAQGVDYNTPTGISSGLTDSFEGSLNQNMLKGENVTNDFIYDQLNIPNIDPQNPHTMSKQDGFNTMNPPCDCLQNVMSTHKPTCTTCNYKI